MKKQAWWHDLGFGDLDNFSVTHESFTDLFDILGRHAALQTSFAGKNARVEWLRFTGTRKKSVTDDTVEKLMLQHYPTTRCLIGNAGGGVKTFVWEDGMLTYGVLLAIVRNEAEAKKLQGLYDEVSKLYTEAKTPRATTVAVLVPSLRGLGTAPVVSLTKTDFVRENYSADVLDLVDRARADIQSHDPTGRFVILDGPPGTGKTHIVKSLLTAPVNGFTLIVPPHATASMQDPQFTSLLLNLRASTIGPILLVIEDADQCLSARKAENMSAISTLLNLSDGMIGSALDIRILATTNTPKAEFDPALLRPGRLSAHIHVGELKSDHAMSIFKRLVPTAADMAVADGWSAGKTLADVYRKAREFGWKVKKTPAAKVGAVDEADLL